MTPKDAIFNATITQSCTKKKPLQNHFESIRLAIKKDCQKWRESGARVAVWQDSTEGIQNKIGHLVIFLHFYLIYTNNLAEKSFMSA